MKGGLLPHPEMSEFSVFRYEINNSRAFQARRTPKA